MQKQKKSRIWNIFVALSILLCAILFGEYKRTLSSKLGEIQKYSYTATLACYGLDVLLNDPDHCKKEYDDYLKEKINE